MEAQIFFFPSHKMAAGGGERGMEELLLARRIDSETPVKCVAIVGGTHGNERHGVHMHIVHRAAVQALTVRSVWHRRRCYACDHTAGDT